MATGGEDSQFSSECEGSSESGFPSLAEFPDSNAYGLRFRSQSRAGTMREVINKEFVVVLDPDCKQQQIETVKKNFTYTDVLVDSQTSSLILKDTGGRKSSVDQWTKPVMDILRKEMKLVKYKVVNTGHETDEFKRQVGLQFSSADLSCTQSKDNQNLLLLSGNPKAIDKAERFIEDKILSLASSGEFVTSSKLRVSVLKGDITQFCVDGIVSAVGRHLSCSGGVSRAIAKAAGKVLVDELKARINDNGPAIVTDVVDTTGGKLHCKKVLHAVGPCWDDYEDKDLAEQHLADTVFNCLVRASDLEHTTIAIPTVSSGSFGFPHDMSAKSYQTAVDRFDKRDGTTSIKHIFFVDIYEPSIHLIRRFFREPQTRRLQENPVKELRLVLVGQIGVGKSALGNNLLSNPGHFLSKQSFKAVTAKTCCGTTALPKHFIKLLAVDTPGLFEPGKNQKEVDDIQKEIIKSLSLLLPGPHAILVVFSGNRFTATEASIYQQVQVLFPRLSDYMIVVFTHVENDELLEELLNDAAPQMQVLIKDCGGRVAAIDNMTPSPSDLERQVNRLTTKVLDLYKANDERYYTNEMIARCLQLMVTAENTDKTLENIKQEILDGEEKKLEEIRDNPHVQQTLRQMPRSCAIL